MSANDVSRPDPGHADGRDQRYLYALDGLRAQSNNVARTAQAAQIIPTPIFASTPELAAALRSDDAVRSAIEDAARVDVAIAGIGSMSKDATLVQWGFHKSEELSRMAEAGLVGDVLGMFFDGEGRYRETAVTDRRIGIGPHEFASIPTKIAAAGGSQKVPAIRAALRGRIFDVLITTETVAQALLEEPTRNSD